MLELVDIFDFEDIVTPELGIASFHGVVGFQQIVAEIMIAGFNHPGMLCCKVAGLVLCPDKTGSLATEAWESEHKIIPILAMIPAE